MLDRIPKNAKIINNDLKHIFIACEPNYENDGKGYNLYVFTKRTCRVLECASCNDLAGTMILANELLKKYKKREVEQ